MMKRKADFLVHSDLAISTSGNSKSCENNQLLHYQRQVKHRDSCEYQEAEIITFHRERVSWSKWHPKHNRSEVKNDFYIR